MSPRLPPALAGPPCVSSLPLPSLERTAGRAGLPEPPREETEPPKVPLCRGASEREGIQGTAEGLGQRRRQRPSWRQRGRLTQGVGLGVAAQVGQVVSPLGPSRGGWRRSQGLILSAGQARAAGTAGTVRAAWAGRGARAARAARMARAGRGREGCDGRPGEHRQSRAACGEMAAKAEQGTVGCEGSCARSRNPPQPSCRRCECSLASAAIV